MPSVSSCWPDDVHLTYGQAYTPLSKAMDNKRPFCDHPYLLSALLGREYVASTQSFRHIQECTEGMKEFRFLRESIKTMLSRTEARMEFVATSRSLGSIFQMDTNRFGRVIKRERLLVQARLHTSVDWPFHFLSFCRFRGMIS